MTIDAMGCQAGIARQIVAQEADYRLAVTGNQPTLHQGIASFFNHHPEDEGGLGKLPPSPVTAALLRMPSAA